MLSATWVADTHTCVSQLNGVNGEATNSDDVGSGIICGARRCTAATHFHRKAANAPANGAAKRIMEKEKICKNVVPLDQLEACKDAKTCLSRFPELPHYHLDRRNKWTVNAITQSIIDTFEETEGYKDAMKELDEHRAAPPDPNKVGAKVDAEKTAILKASIGLEPPLIGTVSAAATDDNPVQPVSRKERRKVKQGELKPADKPAPLNNVPANAERGVDLPIAVEDVVHDPIDNNALNNVPGREPERDDVNEVVGLANILDQVVDEDPALPEAGPENPDPDVDADDDDQSTSSDGESLPSDGFSFGLSSSSSDDDDASTNGFEDSDDDANSDGSEDSDDTELPPLRRGEVVVDPPIPIVGPDPVDVVINVGPNAGQRLPMIHDDLVVGDLDPNDEWYLECPTVQIYTSMLHDEQRNWFHKGFAEFWDWFFSIDRHVVTESPVDTPIMSHTRYKQTIFNLYQGSTVQFNRSSKKYHTRGFTSMYYGRINQRYHRFLLQNIKSGVLNLSGKAVVFMAQQMFSKLHDEHGNEINDFNKMIILVNTINYTLALRLLTDSLSRASIGFMSVVPGGETLVARIQSAIDT